ncbi:hypothetical protein D3C73_918230 [compost metagenome]
MENSLLVEGMVTDFLARALNIDKRSSLTLSDKSTALSFNAKTNILIDLQLTNKTEVKKINSFMEIRNKFLHNWHIKSFTDCFASFDGLEKMLRKEYKLDDAFENHESELAYLYNQLSKDVIGKLMSIMSSSSQYFASRKVDELYAKKYKKEVPRLMGIIYDLSSDPLMDKYDVSAEDRESFKKLFWAEYRKLMEEGPDDMAS